MMNETKNIRVIISGGGTGGHVFPAIAIADAIKQMESSAEILFVGAKDKLEMKKVPQAGYPIKGLWVSGFQRKLSWKNLMFPFKLGHSLFRSYNIVRSFQPQLAIGVGGYASGPVLQVCSMKKVPTLIQEQNSYPGITNKLLAGRVNKICVAYGELDRFFPEEKIIHTGNPVRQSILNNDLDRRLCKEKLGFKADQPLVFVTGGSLGAGSINKAVAQCKERLNKEGVQLLWQTGAFYLEKYRHLTDNGTQIMAFVNDMALAYAAADLVVARAGALSIAELQATAKAAVLVPSPNVAENHQMHNARAVEKAGGAKVIADNEVEQALYDTIKDHLADASRRTKMEANMKKMFIPNAAKNIALEALKMIEPN